MRRRTAAGTEGGAMREDAPVVITGTGAVCALGWGVDELMAGALAGRTGIRPCGHLLAAEGFPGSAADPPSRWPAGTVPEDAGNPLRGSRSTRYALAATEEALRAARLPGGEKRGEEGRSGPGRPRRRRTCTSPSAST
jgi:3-oxoacyl-(acyl-carrier-protein) synthase